MLNFLIRVLVQLAYSNNDLNVKVIDHCFGTTICYCFYKYSLYLSYHVNLKGLPADLHHFHRIDVFPVQDQLISQHRVFPVVDEKLDPP